MVPIQAFKSINLYGVLRITVSPDMWSLGEGGSTTRASWGFSEIEKSPGSSTFLSLSMPDPCRSFGN
jgi:hypothetical protein